MAIVYALLLYLICWFVIIIFDVHRRRKVYAANELQLSHERQRLGKYFMRLRTMQMDKYIDGRAHNAKGTRERTLLFEWSDQTDFSRNQTKYNYITYNAPKPSEEKLYSWSKPNMKSIRLDWRKYDRTQNRPRQQVKIDEKPVERQNCSAFYQSAPMYMPAYNGYYCNPPTGNLMSYSQFHPLYSQSGFTDSLDYQYLLQLYSTQTMHSGYFNSFSSSQQLLTPCIYPSGQTINPFSHPNWPMSQLQNLPTVIVHSSQISPTQPAITIHSQSSIIQPYQQPQIQQQPQQIQPQQKVTANPSFYGKFEIGQVVGHSAQEKKLELRPLYPPIKTPPQQQPSQRRIETSLLQLFSNLDNSVNNNTGLQLNILNQTTSKSTFNPNSNGDKTRNNELIINVEGSVAYAPSHSISSQPNKISRGNVSYSQPMTFPSQNQTMEAQRPSVSPPNSLLQMWNKAGQPSDENLYKSFRNSMSTRNPSSLNTSSILDRTANVVSQSSTQKILDLSFYQSQQNSSRNSQTTPTPYKIPSQQSSTFPDPNPRMQEIISSVHTTTHQPIAVARKTSKKPDYAKLLNQEYAEDDSLPAPVALSREKPNPAETLGSISKTAYPNLAAFQKRVASKQPPSSEQVDKRQVKWLLRQLDNPGQSEFADEDEKERVRRRSNRRQLRYP